MNLNQFNTVCNRNGNLLDLILANFDCSTERDGLPLIGEDLEFHPALSIEFDLFCGDQSNFASNKKQITYNFRRANFNERYHDIPSIDWSPLCSCMFYVILFKIFDKHVLYIKVAIVITLDIRNGTQEKSLNISTSYVQNIGELNWKWTSLITKLHDHW